MEDDNKNSSLCTFRTYAGFFIFVVLRIELGVPFVNITDLRLVEPLDAGPTDSGEFTAPGTDIVPGKGQGLFTLATTTPTSDNSQSLMFGTAEVMKQCGISLPH